MINNLIQVLGQRPASGTNIGDIDRNDSGDVRKDRLVHNGQSKARDGTSTVLPRRSTA
jgi:hypothetical protein